MMLLPRPRLRDVLRSTPPGPTVADWLLFLGAHLLFGVALAAALVYLVPWPDKPAPGDPVPQSHPALEDPACHTPCLAP